MPWSGGNFSRVHDWTQDAGSAINIEASRMDAEDDNFRQGIEDCRHIGGQNPATANLPMGGFRHTGVGNATARDTYASVADVQDQDLIYGITTGSANVYALTLAPAITAYEEGLRVVFSANHTNSGAATLNINGVGAQSINDHNGNALASGMLVANNIYEVTYESGSADWRLTSPLAFVPITAGGTGATSAADARTALGLAIGTDVQAFDADLNAIAALSTQTYGRSLLTTASEAAFKALVNLEIGTDVQAYDDGLADIAGMNENTDSTFIVGSATGWVQESGATVRTSLGLGTGNNVQFNQVNVGGSTNLTQVSAGQMAVAGDAVFSHDASTATYASAKVFFNDAAPTTQGSDGDIWFEY